MRIKYCVGGYIGVIEVSDFAFMPYGEDECMGYMLLITAEDCDNYTCDKIFRRDAEQLIDNLLTAGFADLTKYDYEWHLDNDDESSEEDSEDEKDTFYMVKATWITDDADSQDYIFESRDVNGYLTAVETFRKYSGRDLLISIGQDAEVIIRSARCLPTYETLTKITKFTKRSLKALKTIGEFPSVNAFDCFVYKL